jgi:hypothetical protein
MEDRGDKWGEWLQHILIELKRLDENQKTMNTQIIQNTTNISLLLLKVTTIIFIISTCMSTLIAVGMHFLLK